MINNEVQIKGKIIYIYRTPNRNHILLKVACRGNIVECFICDEELKKAFSDFAVNDLINLTGNIQTTKHKGRISSTVFVEEIRPACFSDNGYYNQFWLEGLITGIKHMNEDNYMCITVRTTDKATGRFSFVPVVFYHSNNSRKLNNLMVGDKIHIQGSIQSVRKKSSEGGYIYYQNYVGSLDKTG